MRLPLPVRSRVAALTVAALAGAVEATRSLLGSPRALRIGARGDDANQRFSGGMDEVAVYDRPLSGGEIATHYLTGANDNSPP